ncbi:MAG: entericidin A/B family lipoprotein [Gallionellaceae bacterium]|nr:entericidin A/B family lipoprotein [Gallionellaceae bacterium]
MKKILALLMALSVLTACNTMEGLGKDIKKGGEKLEKTAK